jgi:CTP synthase
MNKFIFVSGGVCSSLGKGIAASSIGALLEGRGLNVRMVKCDPYINVDAGMQNPNQHGEVYVTDDGAETDLDLGNYARFTNSRLGKANSITTGQVYETVIKKEREGFYNGSCVQVIPHITDEIKNRILAVLKEESNTDVVIIEIGGTVGDIESIPFLEAARQLIHESGRNNAISIHLTLIPEVGNGELKTKPTQHSVKTMQETGIQPDILICRAPLPLDEASRQKIALFTNVDPDAVFTSPNIDTTIYSVPIVFFDQKLDQVIFRKMGMKSPQADIRHWYSVMERFSARKGRVRIGIVGKYMELHDAHKSLYEALFHASLECMVEVELVKIDSSVLEDSENAGAVLSETGSCDVLAGGIDGILIPGGLGQNGSAGMINAAAWARENKIPYLGICQGMQAMVIEWARNVLNWNDADSTEFNIDSKHQVICYGGFMRLGAGELVIKESTHLFAAYNEKNIWERHRNSYEFSNQYLNEIKESGLIIAAQTPDKNFVECIEWPATVHPWGVGVQFYPEFKSRPTAAAPLFRDFIAAVKKNKE